MKIWRLFFAGAMVAILATSGCGPTLGESFKKIENIPPKKALIYIYRPISSVGIQYYVDVVTNGKVVVTLVPGSYSPYLADPGEIEFSTKLGGIRSESLAFNVPESVTLNAKDGQTYYLKTIIGGGVPKGYVIPSIMPSEEGEREIGECKLVLENKA